MRILGVRIDNLSKKQILEKIESFLHEDAFHRIATINPEFILRAQKDERFKNILNGCDMNVADGIGLKYAFWRYGKHLKNRISGVDLMHEVLKLANKNKSEVFLASSTHSLSTWQETAAQLRKKHPSIVFSGGDIPLKESSEWHIPHCDVVLCNFGAPAQELFIDSKKRDTIRLAMGVGGAFDIATGKIPRAPRVMRDFGLEWLWRFSIEPRYRAKRIFRAVVIFPIKIIFSKNR
jgi:N-acetylglucosaminyldiphosphoundecaprenol N-acetyl-beta-D-mannosaminyltransferase